MFDTILVWFNALLNFTLLTVLPAAVILPWVFC